MLPVQQLPAGGILNNGCYRTWSLPQADRQCRIFWTGLAVLLQNQVDLCKALLQEASTQSARTGQARPRILARRLRAECDQQSHQASHSTHPEMCFKRYFNKFSRLQQIFAAGVANPNSQNSTHHDVLDPNSFATTKLRKICQTKLDIYLCSVLEWRAEECQHVDLSRQAVYGCGACHS
jgi:hypothetical protein